ncbi:MAG TPA: serine/threonine-protein kinase [Ktedonobacteraceae bacterium]
MGQQFGNYRLIRHLGTGGCGEVYLGQHIHIRREAAIKILLKLESDEIEQFRQEAQIIANLTHPGIVTIFDYDVAGETPFIVMQYAQQGTLRKHYRRGTRVPAGEVVRYITQAAEALQFAHDHRVVHRDIKPDNMLLGPAGNLLLSDFGIAIVWNSTRSVGVQNASGTLAYMPPEQIMKQPRAASDQYSLAVTAYEWLSGQRPLAGSKMGLGMAQAQYPQMKAPSLRHVSPYLSSQMDDVLQRALAGEWQVRFSTIREFAQELARAAATAFSAPTSVFPLPVQYTYTPIPQAPPPGPSAPAPGSYQRAQVVNYSPALLTSVTRPLSPPPLPALSIIGKIFSGVGMAIGLAIALIGIIGMFAGGEGWYTDVCMGCLFCFFGLLIFFLARLRRSPYPVPAARKIEATIGTSIGLFAVVLGVIMVIVGVIIGSPANDESGIIGSVLSGIEGMGIWLVARIRVRKGSALPRSSG